MHFAPISTELKIGEELNYVKVHFIEVLLYRTLYYHKHQLREEEAKEKKDSFTPIRQELFFLPRPPPPSFLLYLIILHRGNGRVRGGCFKENRRD